MKGLGDEEAIFLAECAKPLDFDEPDATAAEEAIAEGLEHRFLVAEIEAIDPRDGSTHDFWAITSLGRQVLAIHHAAAVAA